MALNPKPNPLGSPPQDSKASRRLSTCSSMDVTIRIRLFGGASSRTCMTKNRDCGRLSGFEDRGFRSLCATCASVGLGVAADHRAGVVHKDRIQYIIV